MKVSIVIPVYNEAAHLSACLEAIAAQTVTPLEVIVVDNNSTDNSVAVAEQFTFARVINEPKQGVIHARTTGFNIARGDIIGRIDADTILEPNWVASVQKIFKNTEVDAVSGMARYYDMAAASILNTVDLFFRRRLERQLKDRVYLWGANMAIRRQAWERVRSSLCISGGLHEDYDLAIHLQELGGRVTFDERLQARVSTRRVNVNYVKFLRYALMSPRTYAQHNIRQRVYMYEAIILCAIGYLPMRLLYRGYDPQFGRFTLSQLIAPLPPSRVDPTTNVA